MMSDLQRALDALNGKQKSYTDLWNYYDGDQPLKYSSQRLQAVFKNTPQRFAQNWCAVVVNSALDRIDLQSVIVENDDTATQELADLFEETELDLDADDVHKAMLAIGEAFVIVWPNEDGTPGAYYNDPRMCHVFYDEENPRKKGLAAKWWQEVDGHWYVTLYYTDRLEKYRTKTAKKKDHTAPVKASALMPLVEGEEWEKNPYGEIPVFHFRADRRKIKGLLADVIDIQNAVNKLFADMMVAAEFGAFKQRWFISNADLDALKAAPDENIVIPIDDEGGAQVGEFSATELTNYLNGMSSLVESISAITSTPRHFFFGQGGVPSGEALIALEAPLNKKVERLIRLVTPVWKRVAAFMKKVEGAEVETTQIRPVFARPQTVQPRTEAEIREINGRAGIPLSVSVKRAGWSLEEIAELEAAIAHARAETERQQAQAALSALRQLQDEQAAGRQPAGSGSEEGGVPIPAGVGA
jgi:hypothetical protein